MKKRLFVRPAALLSAVVLTGCGLLPGQGEDTRTVTVWLMKGSASDDFLERYVPNKTSLASVVEGQEATAAMAAGAARGRATPNSPRWADVEADNPLKPYMTAVLQGRDPKTAARAASERITTALGG